MPLPFSRTLTPDQTSRLTWPETSRRSGSTNGEFRARSARCTRCHGRSCSRRASRTWHPSKPLELASLIRMLPPVKELSSGNLHLKIFRAAVKTGHLPTTKCIDAVDCSRTARNLKPEARLRRDSGLRDPGRFPVNLATNCILSSGYRRLLILEDEFPLRVWAWKPPSP
jgi:hypothetical protein